jgi:hypothetical protein
MFVDELQHRGLRVSRPTPDEIGRDPTFANAYVGRKRWAKPIECISPYRLAQAENCVRPLVEGSAGNAPSQPPCDGEESCMVDEQERHRQMSHYTVVIFSL